MGVLEVSIENYLVGEVRTANGIAVKLNPFGLTGIPDRLVVLPGFIGFVELKRPKNGRVAKLQKWWHDWLRERGHDVALLNTKEKIDEYLRARVAVGRR